MIVSFLESNDFKRTPLSAIELMEVLNKLVANDGADIFLFTNEGLFDNSCWQIVSQLKMLHPNIKRVYVQTGYEDNRDGLQEIENCYDKIFSLEAMCSDKMLAPYVRNRFMVALSDILVTYFDTDKLQTPRIESSTETAIKFAKRYKKQIINLFDLFDKTHQVV